MRYEDAAKPATREVNGWVCKVCGKFYSIAGVAEDMARNCCCDSWPCSTPGCEGRAYEPGDLCDKCEGAVAMREYWQVAEFEWDGKTPLWSDAAGVYVTSAEQILELMKAADKLSTCEELRQLRFYAVKVDRTERPSTGSLIEAVTRHVVAKAGVRSGYRP